MQEAEGKPEDGEETHDHHGEEIAHDPFKDEAEDEEDGSDEEEDTAGRRVWLVMVDTGGDCSS